MTPRNNSTTKTILTSISASVLAGLLIATIWLIVDMRDFVKFKQPEKDSKQDAAIQSTANRINSLDSMQCEKNKATQSRVDNMQDIARRLEFKLDILLDQNIDAKKKIEEMSKYFKRNDLSTE